MIKGRRAKGQTTIYKALHRRIKIKQREAHWKPGVNSCAPEGKAVPASLMTHFVLL